MSFQGFRSVCSQARPELGQAGNALKDYFRQFSTTQPHLVETVGSNDSNAAKATTTARQRTRAAATEINSLAKSHRNASPAGQGPRDAGDMPAQPRVIDVRSLPRGGLARGRGGLRGRGGFPAAGQAGGARARSPSGNRFAGASRGRGAGFGARGGRGGGRGGRGASAGKPRAREEGDKGAAAAGLRGKRQDPFDRMDAAEQEFDDAMRFGTKTPYSPALTLGALAPFVPAGTSTKEGRAATVLQNLSVLGTADPVGTPQNFLARNYAEDVMRTGMRFFADLEAKEAAEQYLQEERREQRQSQGEAAGGAEAAEERIIQDAEEAVQKVILDAAIAGEHEPPTFATDSVGVARSWHLRAGTYTQRDVESFEKKLVSLVSGAAVRGGRGGRGKPQAKA